MSSSKTKKKQQEKVFIHPTAEVSELAQIGPGTIIWNHVQVREDAIVGSKCTLGKNVYIDLGVEIGDNVKIQNSSLLYRGVRIESGVFVGPGVIFANDKRPRAINPDHTLKVSGDWDMGAIKVSYGASIGAGTILLPDITIGRFAFIGAGSLVTKDVPAHVLVIGKPARPIGYVCKCATKLTEEKDGSHICPECSRSYRFDKIEEEYGTS